MKKIEYCLYSKEKGYLEEMQYRAHYNPSKEPSCWFRGQQKQDKANLKIFYEKDEADRAMELYGRPGYFELGPVTDVTVRIVGKEDEDL